MLQTERCEAEREEAKGYVQRVALCAKSGLKPDPDKLEAVRNMPKPNNVQAVRLFCAFVNYLA